MFSSDYLHPSYNLIRIDFTLVDNRDDDVDDDEDSLPTFVTFHLDFFTV